MTRVSGQKRRRRRIISASVFEEKVEGWKGGRTGEAIDKVIFKTFIISAQ